jgi:hypothetical protein
MGRPTPFRPSRTSLRAAVLLAALALTGCGSGGTVTLPPPRPIIVSSGERLRVDTIRMDSIYAWLTAENENIELDPTFLIDGVPAARQRLPWESLRLAVGPPDTAWVEYDRAHPDIVTPYNIYAHLHLMKQMNRIEEWLPDYAGEEGFELERRIVERMADAWLLGRAVFDAPAYQPLDEVMYSKEAGFLDAYLLVARAEEFADERARWEQQQPSRLEEYRSWFQRVFRTQPPGLREAAGGP